LETKKLHQLCGITFTPPVLKEEWLAAKLSFIGGEGYVLGTKYSEVKLKSSATGLCLVTNGEWSIDSSELLGPKVRHGRLYDVEVEIAEVVTLHLANMCPERYPVVLRNETTVRLN